MHIDPELYHMPQPMHSGLMTINTTVEDQAMFMDQCTLEVQKVKRGEEALAMVQTVRSRHAHRWVSTTPKAMGVGMGGLTPSSQAATVRSCS